MISKKCLKKNFLLILFLTINISLLSSCKKDETTDPEATPKRDLAEQYIAENDSIIEFMETHFYNYTDFENIGNNQAPELIIDTIASDNINKTPISEQVKSIDIEVKDDDDNIVVHKLYYEVLREDLEKIQLLLTQFLFLIKGCFLIIKFLIKEKPQFGWKLKM